MSDFEIICVDKQHLPDHHHIVDVGIRGQNRTYSVQEIYYAIDAGDTFHTGNAANRNNATVTKFSCTHCGRPTLKSHADGKWNNNLDNLGSCS